MEKFNFKKRFTSMFKLDLRRLLTSKLFYIVIGACLVLPIIIFVMVNMMAGSVMTDQNGNIILDEFGNPVLMEGFKNVWQMLGSVSGGEQAMTMDIVSMCNINMIYLAIGVVVCVFISQEFRSGYVKNLFTTRSNKSDYVASKIAVSFVCGTSMILAFFIGTLLGGAIANVSFEMNGFNTLNLIMCLLSKIGLVLVFSSMFVVTSVFGKEKLWLSILLGLGVSMLLFTMISLITPLNATFINVTLSFAGGAMFAVGLGAVCNTILKKTRLV